jgi:hypothetical protein
VHDIGFHFKRKKQVLEDPFSGTSHLRITFSCYAWCRLGVRPGDSRTTDYIHFQTDTPNFGLTSPRE